VHSVLQEKVDRTSDSISGLGLIIDDSDIVKIHCSKSFVESEKDEGIEIALYDAGLAEMKTTETDVKSND
jgi:hypothetical protein